MAQCAKCVALSQAPNVKEAGAHLNAMDGKPVRMRLDYAPSGKVRREVTIFTMFHCPEDGCRDVWWRGIAKDGSFVEWQHASEARQSLNYMVRPVDNRSRGLGNSGPRAAPHEVQRPVVDLSTHVPVSLGITRVL